MAWPALPLSLSLSFFFPDQGEERIDQCVLPSPMSPRAVKVFRCFASVITFFSRIWACALFFFSVPPQDEWAAGVGSFVPFLVVLSIFLFSLPPKTFLSLPSSPREVFLGDRAPHPSIHPAPSIRESLVSFFFLFFLFFLLPPQTQSTLLTHPSIHLMGQFERWKRRSSLLNCSFMYSFWGASVNPHSFETASSLFSCSLSFLLLSFSHRET